MNNIFLNKDFFIKHHSKKYKDERIDDFNKIYNVLKTHLVPKDRASINSNKLKKYIDLYKKENKEVIRKILENVVSVSFNKFYEELKRQVNNFNNYIKNNSIKKYVFVLGVGDDSGGSSTDFNLFKSNFWVFLLCWKYLKVKPYDIILNLNTAVRLYYPKIKDFLLVDDCSYSGDQMFNRVITLASTEFLYNDNKGYIVKSETRNTIYEPAQEKLINIHLIIPYLSKTAYNKISEIELLTGFKIIRYNSYIINPYKEILDPEIIRKANELYKPYYKWSDIGSLIPIFFEHKIADSLSTIDLILIKGQVLDNPKKKLVFIDSCEYNKKDPNKRELNPESKDFIYKKLYCPNPPYLDFKKLLLNSLK